MATNFSPCKGSYVLNQFPSIVMFDMKGFHVSASGAIQGHHGPLVFNERIIPAISNFQGMSAKKDSLLQIEEIVRIYANSKYLDRNV